MSANERGLGRGLDALFRNVTPAERPSSAKTDSAEVPAPSVPKNTTTLPIASAAGGPRSAPGLPKCRFICGNCPMRTP